MSVLMSQKEMNSTVTVLHSGSKNIKEICLSADIIISAMGKPSFVTADMVKDGAVIIDVGTTRVPTTETKSGFKLAGDVDFANVSPKCSFITPVPGGVGPMTRLALLLNTLEAANQ
jgi:methylenetetrahydrofolate dehydrogenase (NADP+)/methenyltetrahydrofolate cyclohydrolase